jgi:hypothetical protein
VRQVCSRELEGLGRLGLVLVDLPGVLVVTARLELLEAVLVLLFLGLAWCVVVGCHLVLSCSQVPVCGPGLSIGPTRIEPTCSSMLQVRVTAQIVH